MGFFSAIVSAVKTVAAPVVKAVKTVVSKAKEFFGGAKETAKKNAADTGRMDEYIPETATTRETEDYISILSNLSVKYKDQAYDMENDISQIVEDKFDDIIERLQDGGFDIGFVKKEKRNIKNTVRGSITSQLSERLSLEDDECLEILKMKKGSKKTKRMEEFSFEVIDESLEALITKVNKAGKKVEEKISEAVEQKLDEQENELETKSKEIDSILRQLEEGTFDSEESSVEPNNNIFACSYLIDLLNTEK